ncbi:MAG TPA: hypothetical protein VMW24_18450 [Sedimentisphaerales bacterium]|nr:hypothetical protein [Sedimentisphaerales bacterium]
MDYDNKSERPSQQNLGSFPRGIEVLVKKASVAPEFRQLLLAKRAKAACEIGLELTEAEQKMLSSMPAQQLEKIIDNVRVDAKHRSVFLGSVGKLMLATVVATAAISGLHCASAGISPDRIREIQMKRGADANDVNEPNQAEPKSGATEPNRTGKGK